MEVCFVPRGRVGEFRLESEKKPKLILFGFQGLGEVSYEKEIKGETNYFEEVAKLSRQADCVVVCGCITDTLGHKRKSAVVAEKGRILGVSDMMNSVDEEIGCGSELKVYRTGVGKIGMVVAEDLYFPEVASTLSMCGSEFLVCTFPKPEGIESSLCRSLAFCYGVPVLTCGIGYSCVVDTTGALAFSSSTPSYVNVEGGVQYQLIRCRRRGFLTRKRD